MEGKKITKILDIGGQYRALLLDDDEVAIVKVVVDDLSLEELSEFLPGKLEDVKKPEKKETKKESKPKEKEEEEEEEEDSDDTYTWEDLEEMSYDDLEELCEENELEVEPSDFEDDEVGDFRKAVAEELEIEVPEEEEKEEEEKEEEEKEEEEEDSDDTYTWEDLEEMDFEELQDFCDENELEIDPDDFTEDDEDKFRREIAKEAGIEAPKAKPKRKGKK